MSWFYSLVMVLSCLMFGFSIVYMAIDWAASLKVDWFVTLDGKRVPKSMGSVEHEESYDFPTAPDPKRTLCKIPDCDNAHYSRGWCATHYRRWKRHGSPLAGKAKRQGKSMQFASKNMLASERAFLL